MHSTILDIIKRLRSIGLTKRLLNLATGSYLVFKTEKDRLGMGRWRGVGLGEGKGLS